VGESLDLTQVNVPTFVLSTKEDHIVPWVSSFRTTKVFSGETEFVLGARGHIAGVVNPPAKKKRSFWIDGDQTGDAKGWLATAQEQPGSWWTHWGQWLGRFKGDMKLAKAKLGNAKFKPIEDAPGRYVKVRSE
jgi:polyhydroxyalkanoate synthase